MASSNPRIQLMLAILRQRHSPCASQMGPLCAQFNGALANSIQTKARIQIATSAIATFSFILRSFRKKFGNAFQRKDMLIWQEWIWIPPGRAGVFLVFLCLGSGGGGGGVRV